MKLSSSKITSDHFLLCVFLSLLWGSTDSNTTSSAPDTTLTSSTNPTETTIRLTTPLPTLQTTKAPPEDVRNVTVLTQDESSITLKWDKVNNISTYFLQYDNKEDPINVTHQNASVTHVATSLTAGREYNFTLITTFEGVNSTGYRFQAVTAPLNAEGFKSLDQTETSITLQWEKVENISNYIIAFNASEINVPASAAQQVNHTISGLTSGTEYNFTLFTVFETVKSRGVNHLAVTAPENVKNVNVSTQDESSITLMWDKVNNISTYFLQYDNKEDTINVTHQDASVKYVVSPLSAGRKYNFTLITASNGVNSTGYRFDAVTVPPNAVGFKSADQNETSITLQWQKVQDIRDYILLFNGSEIIVNASSTNVTVTELIPGLINGTKYDFTLFTVFGNVRSSGVNHSAATAPPDAEGFKSLDQNETSITLQWQRVGTISNYVLVFNGSEINVPASAEQVTHTISELTSGTKYNVALFAVFENVRSRGVNLSAATAPLNAVDFKSLDQNETSITLQWQRVGTISNYVLVFNGSEINVPASAAQQVNHTISGLTSGTEYNFTLFTVFENVRSRGANLFAVTAPENVKNANVSTQDESSITLMWDKVNSISTYFLRYDNKEDPINVTHQDASVTHVVTSLTAGRKYYFTVITLFEGVNSTGRWIEAVTVPSMLPLVNVTERSVTSITLTWQRENKDWDYFFEMNGVNPQLLTNRALDVESRSFTSLQPGTAYRFSVITVFSGLNSTAYEDFTVTAIDCTNVTWHVTTSSIQGRVEGLFSNATATNKSQTHVSPGGSNVSFTGLYPGDTYNVSLEYEINSRTFQQCSHKLTIIPPPLRGHCEYWAAGYSLLIVLDEPDGVWTSVEVNVSGESYPEHGNGEERLRIYISGFQPAKTYNVSLTSLSGIERSNEPLVILCRTDPRGVIAGAVFAVLLFCVLVCLAVFIFFKRPDIISRKKQLIGGSKQPKKKCKAISVAKFPDHFDQLGVDENRGFSQEYESLSPVGTEQTRKAATEPENKARNRFNNVLPYDWCRVKLTSSPNGSSDYINANYMPGYNSSREYIATQGPLPSTVNDFWRMIWEQRVNGIVMVTNCTEGGKTKCQRYWPADRKPCLNGELLVTIRSEQEEPYWTLREFSVKHSNNSGERTVKHFHFTAWPDHGVPQGTEALIQFRGLVRRHIEREGAGAPTVVHCSAGVGRTGTIIALDVLLQQLEKERAVGINGFVHKMRLSRPHMVQTESQYVFLHQSIMDRLQPNEKTEENIYENSDMIYVNATALRELR
ncbi:receptor-type tyrosine-protein phosphatase H-like isoform X9 [Sebastes fasciatus]|uniref:receptor-type tyrosine-protein phosphatase H-like isoform X9 n=1 Tax=Sebastes fasciatus TaxID=394691 RepID=UPI003D9E5918